jgi:hypothetical protein
VLSEQWVPDEGFMLSMVSIELVLDKLHHCQITDDQHDQYTKKLQGWRHKTEIGTERGKGQ